MLNHLFDCSDGIARLYFQRDCLPGHSLDEKLHVVYDDWSLGPGVVSFAYLSSFLMLNTTVGARLAAVL